MMEHSADHIKISYKNPYPNEVLNIMDRIAVRLTSTYSLIFDTFLGCFIHTTEELQKPYLLIPDFLFVLPLSIIGLAVAFPIMMLGFIMWYSIHWLKAPYRWSCAQVGGGNKEPALKATYSCMTTNLCLLHKSLCKFNNLDQPMCRATVIGKIIANGQKDTDVLNGKPGKSIKGNNNKTFVSTSNASFDTTILSSVDPPDFLFIQEGSWVLDFGEELGKQLHTVYQHVIYDVAKHSFSGNYYCGSSGLMFASKYPILNIDFKAFKDSCSQCVLASKGLLQVKVYLGLNSKGKKVVGYLFNTHLQAYQGTKPIQYLQMDEILNWTQDYRMKLSEPDEVVAFDILGGDFNLDNMSPVDWESANHDLFREYCDLGRLHHGQDQPWTIGTEMRQLLLYDPVISTPEAMKKALKDPTLVQTYILDANVLNASSELGVLLAERDNEGNVIPSPYGGKRRIDYLLYREKDSIEVISYNFVTQLAKLTDHIPVYMEIMIAAQNM